jgi:prepilin-type processing-associated H-X9-DG protein
MVFVCDCNGANWISLPGGYYWRYTEASFGPGYVCRPPGTANDPAPKRHNGMVNCAFADGHAKAVEVNELTKAVVNSQGRKAFYLDSSNKLHWVTTTTIQIFPYFGVSANYPAVTNHF